MKEPLFLLILRPIFLKLPFATSPESIVFTGGFDPQSELSRSLVTDEGFIYFD